MAHRSSTSTLDEETALALALAISEEEAKNSESQPSSRHGPVLPNESPQITVVVPSGFGEAAETAEPINSATTSMPSSCAGPEEPQSPSGAASPSSRDNGSYPAFVPDQAAMDTLKGARTRRHVLRQNSIHWEQEDREHEDILQDKKRLLDNLALYDLMQKEVKGDGNCQFRALSDQLYHTPKFHSEIRHHVTKQLKSCPQLYKGFADDDFSSYVSSMAKDGTWGDHITLQAAADSYTVRILIVSSFQEECIIEIVPNATPSPVRTLYLSFWHEVHYGSIYPSGSNVTEDTPKTLGSKHLYRFIHKPAPQNMGVLHI